VKENRVRFLRRHPQGASGTVLLKVAFILEPQVNVALSSQTAEFF
jgi:hypothetical protein